ncbi:hypothetical protein [Streptomyces sp. NPDC000134]|uniref:hypothetical protein n=1 Tax=Streptomyces sp. NPDC000134 TaxID=3364536 RepID=UPI0036A60C29
MPLVFATVVLDPLPQRLRQRSADAGYDESYAGFLPHFFDVRPEPGEVPFVMQGEHFETGHLWFVVLLAFSLLLVPAYRWLPRERVRRAGERVAEAAGRRRGAVLLPALVFAAFCALARMEEDRSVFKDHLSRGSWRRGTSS